jgi:transposase InsO family protein
MQPSPALLTWPLKGRLISIPSVRSSVEGERARRVDGACRCSRDNAVMESFYALLQKNVLNRRRRWRTHNELAYEIILWIEVTYNPGVVNAPSASLPRSSSSSPSRRHRASKTTSWQHDQSQPLTYPSVRFWPGG